MLLEDAGAEVIGGISGKKKSLNNYFFKSI